MQDLRGGAPIQALAPGRWRPSGRHCMHFTLYDSKHPISPTGIIEGHTGRDAQEVLLTFLQCAGGGGGIAVMMLSLVWPRCSSICETSCGIGLCAGSSCPRVYAVCKSLSVMLDDRHAGLILALRKHFLDARKRYSSSCLAKTQMFTRPFQEHR